MLGVVPLVILPVISLISVFSVDKPTFWNYTFPIISICVAGAYDTYGRFGVNEPKNIKLGFRLFVDVFVSILAASLYLENTFLRAIPITILVICSLFFIYEIYLRIKFAIMSSEWYRRGVEKNNYAF